MHETSLNLGRTAMYVRAEELGFPLVAHETATAVGTIFRKVRLLQSGIAH